MTVETKDMYWATCPKCTSKMLKIKNGEIEAVCSNPACKSKWLITVAENSFKYEAVRDEASK
ncbi:MAG: hypothetical protein K6E47_09680 [Lachnospiraceae bacterium]|nr:hypothetical protein [Lachnospiraceae bacterium]